MVRVGWTASVAARDRWMGEGTKAGVAGSVEAEDEERSEMRRLKAWVYSVSSK